MLWNYVNICLCWFVSLWIFFFLISIYFHLHRLLQMISFLKMFIAYKICQPFWRNKSEPELLKVPNVPRILNWTFQMFLKTAVVSTNSKRHLFIAGRGKLEEKSTQNCTPEVIQANLRKYLSEVRRLRIAS